MTVSSILGYVRKVRSVGLRCLIRQLGVELTFLRHWFFLRWNAFRFPQRPVLGVTVVSYFTKNDSLNKTMRDFCYSLRDAGIPFQTYNLDAGAGPEQSNELKTIMTPLRDFRLRKFSEVVDCVRSPVPEIKGIRNSSIVFWEADSGVLDLYPYLVGKRSVIALSDFNYKYFQKELPKSVLVSKILYPFRFEEELLLDRVVMRKRFGIPEEAFAVFFNFSLGALWERKNPDGAMRAFALAFSGARNVRLVLKVMCAKAFPSAMDKLRRFAEELGIADRLVIIDSYLPQKELYALTAACDVYLSLHRGEGFGLGMAEAMSMGMPVVATNWSANTEYCKSDNSVLVPCELIKPQYEDKRHLAFRGVKHWAEPNVDLAAKSLRQLYEERGRRERIGSVAQKSIREHYSLEHFRKSVLDFLKANSQAVR